MNYHTLATSICIGAALLACSPATALAGDTDPPTGPVAPTMKTLDEIEPRTAVQSLPGDAGATHIISASGSYYLTGNITGEAGKTGIRVNVNDVTIDLAGFALLGVAGSQEAIENNGTRRNISVFNGTVSGWGADGVRLTSTSNAQLRDLRADSNTGNGLRTGTGSLITRCVAQDNGATGIIAGSESVVTGCTAHDNAENGISPGGRSVLASCAAGGNLGAGFSPGSASTMTGCNAAGNATGIRALSNSTVRASICDQNSVGIQTTGNDNVIEGNTVTRSAIGLDINGLRHTLADNVVKDNTDNYDITSADNSINILLCEIPESIDWPATVTLAGSLTGASGSDGITVNADDVTIDLAGHALVGVPGSLNGITFPTTQLNIIIRNGTIRDWGLSGISAALTDNVRIEDVIALSNDFHGIAVGDNAVVKNCISSGNFSDGISARSGSTITNCTASGNGWGIACGQASIISGCSSLDNSQVGLYVTAHGRISRCVAKGNNDGILVEQSSTVSDNVSAENTISGIRALQGSNRIDSNQVIDNFNGIDIDSIDRNLIIRNVARGNAINYSIMAGNAHGPIVNVSGVGDISAIAGADHPWANFVH